MTQSEEDRLEDFRVHIECGKIFFNQLVSYYTNERMLNPEDIFNLKDNILQLNYLYKPYLLELIYNEELRKGQILVYESEAGTHFLTEPKFKLKENCQIYFDYIGNIFIGNIQTAHAMPSRSAENIIREVCK